MDYSKIGCDSLRLYHTGASSAGSVQSDESLSLGGFVSSTEIKTYDVSVASPIANVNILYASGALPVGNTTKVICTATDTVKLQVGGVDGGAVTLANGDTVQLNMNNVNQPERFVRVSRSGSMATGTATLTLSTKLNNVFAQQDVVSANALSGISKYRMIVLKNETGSTMSNVKIWLPKLGTLLVSNAGQLGSSGSGTITINTGTFADWPVCGWCRIETSGGVLREVVYYSSKTNTTLTVPSTGRGRIGTSAAAGSSTDKLIPIPGMRIALDGDGVQDDSYEYATIANENTAPTISGSWVSGSDDDSSAGHALLISSVPVDGVIPLWLNKEMPASSKATAESYYGINIGHDGTL